MSMLQAQVQAETSRLEELVGMYVGLRLRTGFAGQKLGIELQVLSI
jgi:hypothetical protein